VPGRVLITRSTERAQELLEALRRESIDAIAEPVTETFRVSDASSLPDLARVDWIAFTSANAVSAFAEILSESRRTLPASIQLAAIGLATAKLVREHLRASDVVVTAANGVDLANALLEAANSNSEITVLWPCAEDSLPDFARELTTAGVDVIQWPVYRTKPVAPWILHMRLERATSFEIAVFAAPSAVKSLHEAWPEPWPFTCVAVGPTTAEALRRTGASDVLVSKSPRPADICSTILAALNRRFQNRPLIPVTTNFSNGGSH
jgi:uroporphyrinogen-III synthase